MNFNDAEKIFYWERYYYLLYLLPKIPQDFLSFKARDDLPCVHEILSHIVECDDWWFYKIYLNKPLDPRVYDFTGKKADEIIKIMQEIRQDELTHLKKLGDIDYHQILMPNGDEPGEISLAGIIYHIAEHESYHMGQIFMLADLAGIKFEQDKE